MHGFFVDLRLYEKAKAIANPFEFEEHKKQMVQKKIEEKRQSRISAYNKLPLVNRSLANELMETETEDQDMSKKKKKKDSGIMKDDRFTSLFNDPAFQVDENSFEYKLHHPSEVVFTNQSQTKKFELKDEDGVKFYELKDGFSATDSAQIIDSKSQSQERAFADRVGKVRTDENRGRKTGNMSVSFDVTDKSGREDGNFKRPERRSAGRGGSMSKSRGSGRTRGSKSRGGFKK